MEKLYTLSRHPDLDEMFDFLEGKLPEANMESIEEHLLECDACAAALEEIDRAGGPTSENRESAAEFQKIFLSEQAAYPAPATSPTSRNWNQFFRVAAIVLLALNIGLAGLYFSGSGNSNSFAPYDVDTNRGSGEDTFNSALDFYDKGEYEEAIKLLKDIPDSAPQTELKLLYLGTALLALDRNQEAIAPLQQLVQNPDWDLYRKDGQHYLGIAYMRLGKVDN